MRGNLARQPRHLPAEYREAKKYLATLVRVDAVKKIRDQAIALEVYAYQAKDGEIASAAVEVRGRAERRIGEIMEGQRKAGELKRGGDRKSKASTKPLKLVDQGVDKNLADRARKAARKSEDEFEADLAKRKALAEAAAESNKAVITLARAERHATKKAAREERERELATKLVALPTKKYAVILADPEWQFEFHSDLGKTNSSADNHYTTSSLDAIKARDVPSIAANDCALFLWATVPMLPQALEVMAAWGFSYKSNFVWIKDRTGTGYWNRNKHELLLIGTRGKIPGPADGTQFPSAIEAPAGRHSAKPEIFLEMIEAYFPTVPKIELNRRGAPRNGWDAWGNEVEAA
jgi:N6-adenosine-specific RNA methylase IME4